MTEEREAQLLNKANIIAKSVALDRSADPLRASAGDYAVGAFRAGASLHRALGLAVEVTQDPQSPAWKAQSQLAVGAMAQLVSVEVSPDPILDILAAEFARGAATIDRHVFGEDC